MNLNALLLILVLATSTWSIASENLYYSYKCILLDHNGELVRKYPGGICEYADDGSVYISTQLIIFKYSPENKLVWKVRTNSHHKFFLVGDLLLSMGSSIHENEKAPTRFDTIEFYDLDGNKVKAFDFYDFRKELLKKAKFKYDGKGRTFKTFHSPPPSSSEEFKKNFVPVFNEFSHANSVQILEENSISKKIKAFAAGNLLVNLGGLGLMVIVDKDLKKIIWYSKYPKDVANVHDLQLNRKKDKLAYYNNFYTNETSSIEEYDPIKKVRTILFKGDLENPFFGSPQGGFQFIDDDTILISQLNTMARNKIFKVRNSKIIWSMDVFEMGKTGLPLEGMQEVRLLNLEKFIKNNKPQNFNNSSYQ